MAFLNVSTFAQTAPVQPGLAGKMAEVLAQSLAAQGYEVHLDGTSVKIASDRGELILDLPEAGEESEDSGIRVSLGPQADTSAVDSAEDIENFQQLQLCLNAADLNFRVSRALCELYVNDAGDFLCKTEATFDRVLSSLKCIALYVEQEPPSGDVVSVFVTTTEYQGDLGGLAGADEICQERAVAAKLPGTDWTAWLSDSTENAIDRIPDGQYQLVDGTQVADDKADLTDGKLKAAITLNAFGLPAAGSVWTGTEANGNGTVSNCNNWTVNSSESVGDWGFNGYDNDFWTLIPPPDPCSQEYKLYCFGGVE
jgi:hypothetical protein